MSELAKFEKDVFDNDLAMKEIDLVNDMGKILGELNYLISEKLEGKDTDDGCVQGMSDGIFLLELRFNQYKYKYGLKGTMEE